MLNKRPWFPDNYLIGIFMAYLKFHVSFFKNPSSDFNSTNGYIITEWIRKYDNLKGS